MQKGNRTSHEQPINNNMTNNTCKPSPSLAEAFGMTAWVTTHCAKKMKGFLVTNRNNNSKNAQVSMS
jgi:hypothetical protein